MFQKFDYFNLDADQHKFKLQPLIKLYMYMNIYIYIYISLHIRFTLVVLVTMYICKPYFLERIIIFISINVVDNILIHTLFTCTYFQYHFKSIHKPKGKY